MTTVQETAAVRYGMWVLCPAIGAALVWGLKLAASWVTGLSWFPFQGVFELVTDIPDPWATIGAIVLGVIAGVVFALIWASEMLAVDVAHDRVTLRKDDQSFEFLRGEVESAFADGKQLVLLAADGTELARETSDLSAGKLRAAFEAQGFRWREADPFADDFLLWVEHTPELPPDVNALLAARKKAIDEYEHGEAGELAREIRKRGVFVKDTKKRQYYRCAR
ncbi:hypothetical protein [Nocardia sp. NRRL S-836]|uniref:YqeB family protein n=1 Tax=Nocardia sp. NRRL S-836 TaxID=1519492 RepID=UPI0006C4957B|nr:hypothetical protein [Nocardia sp. NRRL S-836]KOV82072.1 hypothetical protein ADL03_26400 [Nocardia sp. NRRL S-836]